MSITIEVNSVDVTQFWQREPEAGWDDPLMGRGTGRIVFADVVGGFTPSDGQTIEVIENGTVRFGGILIEPEEVEEEDTGVIWYSCTTADYNILADRRLVGETWDSIAFETIVSGIVFNHMDGEGITIAGVETGAAQSFTANLITATEALNALGALENKSWRIDDTKDLEFKDRDSIAAPFDMDGTTLLMGTVMVRSDRQKYRNQMTVRAGTAEFPIIATSGNLAEQSARATIEGTSGIYEDIVDEPDIVNQDVAMELAGDLLSRFDQVTQVVVGQTRLAGFRSGQFVNVDLPNHGINNVGMIIDSVTAVIKSIGDDEDEIWYTISAITGDPYGGWMEHYRKAPPQTVPLTFENTPGLFRIDPKPGAVVHDPLPDDFEWFQGAASGSLDFTPVAIGITHQTKGNLGFKVDIRRGPVATPRQSICETYAIDGNELVDTTPNDTFQQDELVASSFKSAIIIRPDNTHICCVERDPGFAPRFRVVQIAGAGAGWKGNVVATGMPDNNNHAEGCWVGNFVFWPGNSDNVIYIFDVSDPDNPTLDNSFTTSLSTCSSCVPSSDGNSLYATGAGTGLVVAIDITDPTTPTEDDTQATTSQYSSLDINETDDQLIMLTRADASNVRYARIDVTAGTTLTLLDEALEPLATSVMVGVACMYNLGAVIVWRERPAPTTVNDQRAHVFDVDAIDGVTFRETLSYNHGISGNLGPERSFIGKRAVQQFGFNTDAEVTFGKVVFQTSVPLTIDCPLRVGFGGTGLAKYVKGDIVYADRVLPDDLRGQGELTRLPIGSTDEHLVVSGGLPAWQAGGIFNGDVQLNRRVQRSKESITLGGGVTTFVITRDFVVLTGDGAANTIATITGGLDGQILRLLFVDALVTITDDNTHAANTVDLNAAFTSADDTLLLLMFDGTSWYEVSRSVN